MPSTRHSTELAERRAALFCAGLLAAMLLLASGCGKRSDGTVEVSEPPFKARLPENANRREYSLESEEYGATRTIINGVRRGSVYYQFATKSFPPEMTKGLEPERIFLGFRQDGAFRDFAKVSDKRLLQVGGYPAMDVDFEGVLRSPADNSSCLLYTSPSPRD